MCSTITMKMPADEECLVESFIESILPVSPRRAEKHRTVLTKVRSSMLDNKPFRDVTRADLNRVWGKIDRLQVRHYGTRTGPFRDAADWTKHDHKVFVKRFYRWLKGDEFVKGLKVKMPDETVSPEDILTEEELVSIRKACHNIRDRALCETMYESAARPHELLGMRKNDVIFDEYGAVIYIRPSSTVSGQAHRAKTGPRRIRLMNAAPLLSNWIANHPREERDAALWVELSHGSKGTPLKRTGLVDILGRWVAEARIEKRVTPYIFRHTRITQLASWMTDAQLCLFAGWRVGSLMPRTYIHLNGKDVDNALLKAYGVKTDTGSLTLAGPKKCPRCGTASVVDAEICSSCGLSFSLQASIKKDEELEQAKQNLAALVEKLKDKDFIVRLANGAKLDPVSLDLVPQDSEAPEK